MKNRKVGLAVLGVFILGLSLFLVSRGMKAVAPPVSGVSAPVALQPAPDLSETDLPDDGKEVEASVKEEQEADESRSPDEDNKNSEASAEPSAKEGQEAGQAVEEKTSAPSEGARKPDERKADADSLKPDVKAFAALFTKFEAYETPEDLSAGVVFTSTQGRDFRFGDFRGGWLVLNFWASWCPPCVEELPAIDSLRKKFQNTSVQIVAVSVDPKTDAKGVAAFVAEKKLGDVALYYDSKGEVQKALSLEGLPVTLIVNPKGQIVYRITGDGKWDTGAAEQFLRGLSAQ